MTKKKDQCVKGKVGHRTKNLGRVGVEEISQNRGKEKEPRYRNRFLLYGKKGVVKYLRKFHAHTGGRTVGSRRRAQLRNMNSCQEIEKTH